MPWQSLRQLAKTMRLLLLIGLTLSISGCTVIAIADAAATAVIKTVKTAVEWVIPD